MTQPLWRITQVCTVMALFVLASACQKDEFAKVPVAKAPTVAKTNAKTNPQPAAKASPQMGLPANHPPTAGPIKRAGPLNNTGAATGARPSGDGKSGPLRWSAPEGWQASKPKSQMRLGEYIAPGPEGQQPAVMSIFYFGARGGGGVDANIERWVGQFKNADGTPITNAKRATQMVGKIKVHTVDVTGTYGGGMGGGGAQKDFRVLGAIAESPAGLFFFKLLGPSKTMAANEAKFNGFVKSLKAP